MTKYWHGGVEKEKQILWNTICWSIEKGCLCRRWISWIVVNHFSTFYSLITSSLCVISQGGACCFDDTLQILTPSLSSATASNAKTTVHVWHNQNIDLYQKRFSNIVKWDQLHKDIFYNRHPSNVISLETALHICWRNNHIFIFREYLILQCLNLKKNVDVIFTILFAHGDLSPNGNRKCLKRVF